MKDYKIVSCASFGSSGSGVVTDYLSEFENINNFGFFEFRILQDIGGVTSLDDTFVNSYHRLNADISIQNFINFVEWQAGDIFNKRYEQFFHGQFKKISYDFLSKLLDVTWDGFWGEYLVMAPRWKSYLLYKIYPHFMRLLGGNRKYIAHYIPHRDMYFSSPTKVYFCECVKWYLTALCEVIDPSNKYDYIYFDQLLPPTGINRYFDYFEKMKAIVVDRDPRDYYLENVVRWGEGWVPKDVNKFVVLYRKQREQINREKDSENVLRIRFEDAIYHYDEFSKRVNHFLNLDEKLHSKDPKFMPSRSINNTMLWKKSMYVKELEKIKFIESELEEYLYPFE